MTEPKTLEEAGQEIANLWAALNSAWAALHALALITNSVNAVAWDEEAEGRRDASPFGPSTVENTAILERASK